MKMIRDFIEVNDHISLDSLIEALTAARAALPEGAAADVRMKGDDIFGRKLSISYLRPQTAEEAALDARYAETCQVHSAGDDLDRSEEHTSELQSLMRISYAVFCLKKKTNKQ